MVSQSFFTQSSINKLLINKQVRDKPLFVGLFGFFSSLECSHKLSLFINFIEFYSLQVSMTWQGMMENLSIKKQEGCSAKKIIFPEM